MDIYLFIYYFYFLVHTLSIDFPVRKTKSVKSHFVVMAIFSVYTNMLV